MYIYTYYKASFKPDRIVVNAKLIWYLNFGDVYFS